MKGWILNLRTTQQFIKDGLLLTATMLILRTAGVFFSARLSILAGSAVMGLYTQIMSVYSFAVTAASAGVNLGALRLTSECYGSGREDEIRTGVRQCMSYCLKVGIAISLIFFTVSPFLGGVLLGDTRTIASLRALSVALPFIAVSNAFHGYFNGVNRIYKSAAVNLIEQFVRITMTLTALSLVNTADTESVCLALVGCNAFSEAFSCFILLILYIIDSRRFPTSVKVSPHLKKRFIGITVPVAFSSMIRSGLTTAEHILIPIGLRSFGADNQSALSQYGIVSGMVMPILLYPMALLSAFASVTISELSARASAGESRKKISETVSKGIGLALIYGIGCASIIRFFAEALGVSIYGNNQVSGFLRIMAPLIILMYLDHIADGMLKGLDKQNYVMKVNIIDAALSVVFAVILIPRFGIYGFVASIYICEFLNCACSFGMLMYTVGFPINIINNLALPTFCSIIAVWVVSVITSVTDIGIIIPEAYVTIGGIVCCVLLYYILLRITGVIKSPERHKSQ